MLQRLSNSFSFDAQFMDLDILWPQSISNRVSQQCLLTEYQKK